MIQCKKETVTEMMAETEIVAEAVAEWFSRNHIRVQRFPLYDSAEEMIADEVSALQYESFCENLKNKCVYENKILENRYKLFFMGEEDVYAYYTAGEKRMRVICSRHRDHLKGRTDDHIDGPWKEYCAKTKLSVLNMSYEEQNGQFNGLCIVFMLHDGRFIIYDSGYRESDGKRLYQFLSENNIREDGIHIAAWILTHGHEDHYGAFVHFTGLYSDRVSVQYFMMNPVLHCNEGDDFLIEVSDMIRKSYPQSEQVILHSGMKFHFCNLQLEVLFTHEDVLPQAVDRINDASVITKVRVNGTEVLMMGDCQNCVPIVHRALKEYVKSDILQVPHHGDSGGTEAFYGLVDPGTVIYTTAYEKFEKERRKDWKLAPNHYLLNALHVKDIIVADQKIQTIEL